MFRKLASTVLAFRAILMIGHGLVWLFVKQATGETTNIISTASSVISMISITGGLLLLTFAFLGSRRGKEDLAANNAAIDAGTLRSGDDAFDPDAVMERYLANRSAQSVAAIEDEVGPVAQPIAPPQAPMANPARAEMPLPHAIRPVFGRKAA